MKQMPTSHLLSANSCKGHIAAVGFYLSAVVVAACLVLLTLWMMGYAALYFSSRAEERDGEYVPSNAVQIAEGFREKVIGSPENRRTEHVHIGPGNSK